MVDSLSLLAGGRASSETIRTGADTLVLSGVFEPSGSDWRRLLEEAGVPADGDELLVRREVTRAGRNRVFVNDHPVTLRLLSAVTRRLIRIFGQRDELGMLSPELQRAWLDRSGGGPVAAQVASCASAYEAYRETADRLERLSGDDQLRLERIDLLKFQTSEIGAAHLSAGEDEELRAEREVLRHAEAIAGALHRALALLTDDDHAVDSRLAQAGNVLQDIARWQPEAGAWADTLAEAGTLVNDLTADLRTRAVGFDSDPRRLDRIEERLSVIERLTRKYGGNSADVLEHGRRLAEELFELETADVHRDEVEEQAAACLAEYAARAGALSLTRRELGAALGERCPWPPAGSGSRTRRVRGRDRPCAAPRQRAGTGRRARRLRSPGRRPGDLSLQRQPGRGASPAGQGRLWRRAGAPVSGAPDRRARRRPCGGIDPGLRRGGTQG